MSLMTVDMAALAATYPSVAAALKAAGLTARQEEGYRIALLGAKATRAVPEAGTPIASSVQGRNLAFLEAHQDELTAVAVASDGLLPVAWLW
jgi:hypothetical protein